MKDDRKEDTPLRLSRRGLLLAARRRQIEWLLRPNGCRDRLLDQIIERGRADHAQHPGDIRRLGSNVPPGKPAQLERRTLAHYEICAA